MVEKKVIEILAEYKDCAEDEISIESSFKDLDLDSLDTVEIVMSLEEAFDIELKISEEFTTIKDVVNAIKELV